MKTFEERERFNISGKLVLLGASKEKIRVDDIITSSLDNKKYKVCGIQFSSKPNNENIFSIQVIEEI